MLKFSGSSYSKIFQTANLPLRTSHIRTFSSRNWIGKKDDQVECKPEKLVEIANELKSEAKRLGFGLVGITSPRQSARFEKYREWLANEYHGELDYMEREDRISRRKDPQLILPGAKSVIMVGMMYWPGKTGFPSTHDPSRSIQGDKHSTTEETNNETSISRGICSSYAWGDDYHKILGNRLKKLGKHLNKVAGGVGRFYVDTGAILERDFAERAGLGFIGKNSLLINPRVGSGFFIGELFSTVPLPLDGDGDIDSVKKIRGKPGCGKCVRCKVACPTGAIVEDRVVDARLCISYLTIELKGSIPIELRSKMGARIYGCDICQQVCPWNRIAWDKADSMRGQGQGGYSPLFGKVEQDITSPDLTKLLEADEEEFKEMFGTSAIKRIGRERMARNAAVGLGNVGGEEDLQVLERVATEDKSQIVREHAEWATHRIKRRLMKERRKEDIEQVELDKGAG